MALKCGDEQRHASGKVDGCTIECSFTFPEAGVAGNGYAAIAGELSLRERSRTASAVAIQPSIVVGLGARLRR